jgi:hypothetical protein
MSSAARRPAAHRSAPAHNVQVMITRVERLAEDGLTKDTLWGGEEVRMSWQWEANKPGSSQTRTVVPSRARRSLVDRQGRSHRSNSGRREVLELQLRA